jgi:hypothetical protein
LKLHVVCGGDNSKSEGAAQWDRLYSFRDVTQADRLKSVPLN